MNLAAFDTGPIATARRFSSYLRGLRRWCVKTGRDTSALTDMDLADWVASARASGDALRITLHALSRAYASRGLPSPIGACMQSAVAHRLAAPRARRRLTHRVAA